MHNFINRKSNSMTLYYGYICVVAVYKTIYMCGGCITLKGSLYGVCDWEGVGVVP